MSLTLFTNKLAVKARPVQSARYDSAKLEKYLAAHPPGVTFAKTLGYFFLGL